MPSLKDRRVLVTPTTYGKNDPSLRTTLEEEVGQVVYSPESRPLTSEELQTMIGGVDGFIAGLDEIDRRALEVADRLKVISRYGVGVDNVDLAAARERGIVVTNTPGANSVSVAELTVALLLALCRNIPAAAAATKAGQWPRFSGITLEGKTVGLLGFGSIAKHVARRLQGFGCRVLAYHRSYDVDAAAALGVELRPEDELVQEADFLSLHLPVTPDTRGKINADLVGRMKPGAFIVNTSRGELIDEDVLLAALKTGKLRGAAVDVFAKQPPDPGNPLLALPQVIATPHMGAHTDGATNAMGWIALRDCLAVLKMEVPEYRVV